MLVANRIVGILPFLIHRLRCQLPRLALIRIGRIGLSCGFSAYVQQRSNTRLVQRYHTLFNKQQFRDRHNVLVHFQRQRRSNQCYPTPPVDPERLRRPDEMDPVRGEETDLSSEFERIDRRDDLEEDDEGGAESFFAWFFRGNGPSRVLSGAAFQKNRLSSTSSAYATLFEDDYVANLLDVDAGGVLESLARVTGESPERCTERLRRLAFGFFQERSRQREGYPRLYVYEGYQAAGLALLRECDGEIGKQAGVVLEERFPGIRPTAPKPPGGFPAPDVGLGVTTLFIELRRNLALRKRLWPEEVPEDRGDFRAAFRRQEQRRELLSAMARLGASYIDLYLLAIARIGSMSLGQRRETESAAELAVDFVALLERQIGKPGFHAFHELSQAAEAFDHIVSVNFPEAPSCPLPELARLYGVTLQKQVPVGRMSGGVNQRLVRQFRMPGFPLVLVTTGVLQEGEDLHTFCRRVMHYGIAWTPSAMEQRTGRVDRIGGLVQRRLDGSPEPAAADDLIQVCVLNRIGLHRVMSKGSKLATAER